MHLEFSIAFVIPLPFALADLTARRVPLNCEQPRLPEIVEEWVFTASRKKKKTPKLLAGGVIIHLIRFTRVSSHKPGMHMPLLDGCSI